MSDRSVDTIDFELIVRGLYLASQNGEISPAIFKKIIRSHTDHDLVEVIEILEDLEIIEWEHLILPHQL